MQVKDYERPAVNPWLIAASMVLPTFMVVLDTSVANVALPHIAGSLSASTDEASWVLTSYLVANAIILPATAWFSAYFGRKRFLMTSIVAFTLASAASGAATSLGMLVVARVVQGASGGALLPISQAVLLESFPPEERGQAMAAYAVGVIVAPIVGPALGGWITDNYTWRWIFYINVPVGALALAMTKVFIEDPAYIRQMKAGKLDYAGFALMALGLGTLQVVLDKGQQDDWFSAAWIVWFTALSGVSLVLFVIWEMRVREPIVKLRIFANRNFSVGVLMATAYGVILYSTLLILPLFLEDLMDYPALESGLAISPRGIGAMFSAVVSGRLLKKKLDERILIASGFLLLAWASHLLGGINLQITAWNVAVPNVIMGVAMGMIFVPLTTITVGMLEKEEIGTATGLYTLLRNMGGSIGIAVVTTLLARRAQVHQNIMAAHLAPFGREFQQVLHSVQAKFQMLNDPYTAASRARAFIYQMLGQQATLLAYMDNFRFLGLLALTVVPLTFLLRKKPGRKKDSHPFPSE
ncbi:MAG: DHA2 family efflux MFS transporter permease subunit [Nitrospiraceae bacterium]|nr:DHA2 family efflux MFS transporter permease subunit [Nitrospiraceae bacterium]